MPCFHILIIRDLEASDDWSTFNQPIFPTTMAEAILATRISSRLRLLEVLYTTTRSALLNLTRSALPIYINTKPRIIIRVRIFIFQHIVFCMFSLLANLSIKRTTRTHFNALILGIENPVCAHSRSSSSGIHRYEFLI